jgi:fucose permease
MMTSTAQPVTEPARKRLPRALIYFASYIVLGLTVSASGPNLPGLAEQTGSNLSQISIIFAASSFGFLFGAVLGGWLFDRQSGHPVLAVNLSAMALLLFLIPLAPSRWLLAFIFLLIGAGMGILDVGGNALIVWLFGREVGPYMNALHLFFGVGAVLSPVLVDRIVIATGGIRWVYWILAALAVPVAIWTARVPSPPRPTVEDKSSSAQSMRRYSLFIVMIALFFFLHTGTEIGFGGWIFSYATKMKIGSDTTARLLNSLFWGGLTLGRLVSIPLAVKMRPRTMLLLDLFGAVASIAVLRFLPGWQPSVWIGTFGLGF